MTRRLQISAAALSLLVLLAVFLLPATATPAAVVRGKQIGAHLERMHVSAMVPIEGTTAVVAIFLSFGLAAAQLRLTGSTDLLRQACALRC